MMMMICSLLVNAIFGQTIIRVIFWIGVDPLVSSFDAKMLAQFQSYGGFANGD
jgi:hypothetical protein